MVVNGDENPMTNVSPLIFTKLGVVIPLGASGEFDDVHTSTPAVVYRHGRVWCYYTGTDGSNARIGLAISKDGIHFVKKGVVIPLGASGEFDDVHTNTPAVVYRHGRVWCYYSGTDGSTYRIGLSISRDDGHTQRVMLVPGWNVWTMLVPDPRTVAELFLEYDWFWGQVFYWDGAWKTVYPYSALTVGTEYWLWGPESGFVTFTFTAP
jgi:RNase P protein component